MTQVCAPHSHEVTSETMQTHTLSLQSLVPLTLPNNSEHGGSALSSMLDRVAASFLAWRSLTHRRGAVSTLGLRERHGGPRCTGLPPNLVGGALPITPKAAPLPPAVQRACGSGPAVVPISPPPSDDGDQPVADPVAAAALFSSVPDPEQLRVEEVSAPLSPPRAATSPLPRFISGSGPPPLRAHRAVLRASSGQSNNAA